MWKLKFGSNFIKYQPLANNLLKKKNEKTNLYPLELNYCEKCNNCQLSVDKSKENVCKLSLIQLLKHLELFHNASKKYIKEFKLNSPKSYIIDIGSERWDCIKAF